MQALLIAVLVSMAAHAHAHDLWLEKEGGGFSLYYGHKYSAHQGAEFVEYRPEWVREALCFDGAAEEAAFESHSAYPYRMRGDCAAAYVLISSGYWTKTPYGTENLPRSEARMPLRSWLSYESVKRIDRWNDALAKPLAKGLEITSALTGRPWRASSSRTTGSPGARPQRTEGSTSGCGTGASRSSRPASIARMPRKRRTR
jgi:nickel transport protein